MMIQGASVETSIPSRQGVWQVIRCDRPSTVARHS